MKQNKDKKIITIVIIFSFIILNTLITINIFKNKIISKDIIRLHVVANSNDIKDQIVKLKIENKLEEYISKNISNDDNKENLLNEFKTNSNKILEIANSQLNNDGFNYSAKLNVGKIRYEEKQSIDLDMSAGTYDSVKVILGDGSGKNIWTLIFPDKEKIKKIQELETILPGISKIYGDDEEKETENTEFSFKFIEVINNIKDYINKAPSH